MHQGAELRVAEVCANGQWPIYRGILVLVRNKLDNPPAASPPRVDAVWRWCSGSLRSQDDAGSRHRPTHGHIRLERRSSRGRGPGRRATGRSSSRGRGPGRRAPGRSSSRGRGPGSRATGRGANIIAALGVANGGDGPRAAQAAAGAEAEAALGAATREAVGGVTITTADATARAAAGAGEAGQPSPKPADWDIMTKKQKKNWHHRGGKWR